MYAKVFAQIFDSSIAENHKTRHVFEDLLKLADSGGDVDMTTEAIARRTNVPLGEVEAAISELEKEDKKSRSPEFEGKRIIRLDDHRTWGWHIVNYQHYRNLIDEDSRRSFFRDAKRKQRKRQAEKSLGKVSKNAGQPLPGEEAHVRGVENGTIDAATGEAVRGAGLRLAGPAGGRVRGVEAGDGGVSVAWLDERYPPMAPAEFNRKWNKKAKRARREG